MNKSMLKRSLAAVALMMVAAESWGQFRVAACDWMMLKRQKIGEFQLARDIEADGIEMDMGPLGQREQFDNKLRDAHFQQLFRTTADSLGIAVPSLAMSGFFAQSFLERANYQELIADCLQSMDVMGATVAFLPLGGSGDDWKQAGAARQEMVHRLHTVGEMAQAKGKVIAIRTALPACANLLLLKEVASRGIKIYYNLQDAVDQGWNVCKDLKRLGCEGRNAQPFVRPTSGQPFASKTSASPWKSRLSVTHAPFHAFGTSPVTWNQPQSNAPPQRSPRLIGRYLSFRRSA